MWRSVVNMKPKSILGLGAASSIGMVFLIVSCLLNSRTKGVKSYCVAKIFFSNLLPGRTIKGAGWGRYGREQGEGIELV